MNLLFYYYILNQNLKYFHPIITTIITDTITFCLLKLPLFTILVVIQLKLITTKNMIKIGTFDFDSKLTFKRILIVILLSEAN